MTIQTRSTPLLPGIPVAGFPAAPRPERLLAAGTLLLAHSTPGRTVGLSQHHQVWGPLPRPALPELAASAERMGLLGAGGAGFPTARKLHSLAHAAAGPVIVNGSEGETASAKDTVLLLHVPHLVLDGAVAAARALGSRRVIVRIPGTRTHVIEVVRRAIAERHDRIRVSVSPGADTFVAGEASAVISSLQGGPAMPIPLGKPPTMRGGLRLRPVMLSNVETFARLALAARGVTATSALVTLSGAVATPGVLEVATSTRLGDVLDRVAADPDLAAVITGGWHGTWLPDSTVTRQLPLERAALKAAGAHYGAGAFIALPHNPCPVDVLMAVTDYLRGEGAGQCGPCVLGMAAARQDLLAAEPVRDRVQGRGLCAHPTATITALRSGQRLLADELAAHAAGRCEVNRWT